MRRACRRSARTRASVLLPTRSGPSMAMKRGGCGPRWGTSARLAAEESLPGIVRRAPIRFGATPRIIANLMRLRGCGLDVHQTALACLLIVLKNGQVHKQVRTFGTATRELLSLREWLLSQGCTHVAMENTGVDWTALVEAANAAARAKGTYLRDKFSRLKARRGYKRAAVAVAHTILVAIDQIFSHQVLR